MIHAGGTATATLDSGHRGDILAATGLARSAVGAGSSFHDRRSGRRYHRARTRPERQRQRGLAGWFESHVDVAALNDWFAAQGATALARFNRGCRITPFINGPEYFDDLFTELHATTLPVPTGTPKPLLYLTGYGIDHSTEFGSVASGVANRSLQDVATMLAEEEAKLVFLHCSSCSWIRLH